MPRFAIITFDDCAAMQPSPRIRRSLIRARPVARMFAIPTGAAHLFLLLCVIYPGNNLECYREFT